MRARVVVPQDNHKSHLQDHWSQITLKNSIIMKIFTYWNAPRITKVWHRETQNEPMFLEKQCPQMCLTKPSICLKNKKAEFADPDNVKCACEWVEALGGHSLGETTTKHQHPGVPALPPRTTSHPADRPRSLRFSSIKQRFCPGHPQSSFRWKHILYDIYRHHDRFGIFFFSRHQKQVLPKPLYGPTNGFSNLKKESPSEVPLDGR